jgi:hypothetical protein
MQLHFHSNLLEWLGICNRIHQSNRRAVMSKAGLLRPAALTLPVMFAIAMGFLVTPSVNASTLFTATLSGANEVPPHLITPATGAGSFLLNDAQTDLFVTLSFSGLLANETGAHIHAPAAPGANAAVVLPLPTSPAKAFTFSQDFPLAASLVGLTPAQFVDDLFSGLAYVNVHSTVFPGGEIRGQLIQTPEPAGSALLGTGLLAAAGFAARRKNRAVRT